MMVITSSLRDDEHSIRPGRGGEVVAHSEQPGYNGSQKAAIAKYFSIFVKSTRKAHKKLYNSGDFNLATALHQGTLAKRALKLACCKFGIKI